MSQAPAPAVRHRTRALALDGAEGTVLVRRALYGAEHESQEQVRVQVFHTDPARVRVEGSVTKNLGDFNSARVAVLVELPCYPEATEIQRAYEVASGMVDRYLERELQIATQENPPGVA
jgi:hypothetical protein